MRTGQSGTRRSINGLVAIGILAAAAGCNNAGLYPGLGGLTTHENSAVVGQEGGIIVAGGAAITIPPGALAEPVEIMVQPVDSAYPSAAHLQNEQVFAFLPHGTQFLQPVTITVPHSHSTTDDLALYTAEPDVPWGTVPGASFTPDRAIAQVSHFSFFFASPMELDDIDPGGAGGSAGRGGTGGATGRPDAGAAPGSENYRNQDPWHGYMYVNSGGAATITGEGTCATGVVDADPEFAGYALWGWNLNQDEAGNSAPWQPDRAAVHYDIAASGSAPLRLVIYTESGDSWCVPITESSGDVALADFTDTCWNDTGTPYDGSTPLVGIQVLVPSAAETATPFEFCVNELHPTSAALNPDGSGGSGGAGGEGGAAGEAGEGGASTEGGAGGEGGAGPGAGVDYLVRDPWHGYLYEQPFGLASIERAGTCVEGLVPADDTFTSFAHLGWNINEDELGNTATWTPDTTTLSYDITTTYDEPLRLVIYDDNGTYWCLPLGATSGEVELTDFNTECWSGEGTYYDGAVPIQGIQVQVPGDGSFDTSFEFCLNELGPVTDGGSPGGSGGAGGAGGAGADAGVGGEGGASGEGGEAGEAGEGGASTEGGAGGEGGAGPGAGVDYLVRDPWHGYLYEQPFGLASIERAGTCVEGLVPADDTFTSFAHLGWNINEDELGNTATWTPDTTTLSYDITTTYDEPLRLVIYDDNGTYWCLPLGATSGEVELTDFNTECWSGEGTYYDGAVPIQGIQVQVPGDGSFDTSFEFCLNELGPVTDGGSPGGSGGAGGAGGAGADAGVGGEGGASGEGGEASDAGVAGEGGATSDAGVEGDAGTLP